MTSSSYTIIDIGETVLCDLCNADYTDSEDEGGILMGTYSICPTCAPGGHPRCGTLRRAFRPLSRTDTLQGLGASTQEWHEHHRNHCLLSITVLGTAGGLPPPAFFLLSFPLLALPQCYGSSVAGGEAAPGRVSFPLRPCSLLFALLVRCARPEMTWCSGRAGSRKHSQTRLR